MGAAGDTTPTDPRSQRNRASRRGGQLTNASSQLIVQIGLPAPSCSRCPSPLMVAPYATINPTAAGTAAPTSSYRLTIRSSACCVRSGDARAWLTRFPMGNSALNLAAARLRHIAGTAWSTKRYLNITAEGPADERGHHRLSQYRAPLSPRPKCENCWTLPPGTLALREVAARLRLLFHRPQHAGRKPPVSTAECLVR